MKVKVRDWGNKELCCVEICLWRESGVLLVEFGKWRRDFMVVGFGFWLNGK